MNTHAVNSLKPTVTGILADFDPLFFYIIFNSILALKASTTIPSTLCFPYLTLGNAPINEFKPN